MSDQSHQFFLEALDPDYGCPVLETMFEVADLADLHAVLGQCAADDLELRGCYPLEADDLANIAKRFGVDYCERYVGTLLRKLGFSHVSARPRHPAQDAEVVAAYKKTLRAR